MSGCQCKDVQISSFLDIRITLLQTQYIGLAVLFLGVHKYWCLEMLLSWCLDVLVYFRMFGLLCLQCLEFWLQQKIKRLYGGIDFSQLNIIKIAHFEKF